MVAEEIDWLGSLEETEFLSRLYDLKSLPSNDYRFSDAAGDIWQHRVNNFDWDDHWVFHDRRFDLMNGDDEILLQFLAESVHPVVRPDVIKSKRIVQLYNKYLKSDGFELAEKSRISGKPIYAGRNVCGASSHPNLGASSMIHTDGPGSSCLTFSGVP